VPASGSAKWRRKPVAHRAAAQTSTAPEQLRGSALSVATVNATSGGTGVVGGVTFRAAHRSLLVHGGAKEGKRNGLLQGRQHAVKTRRGGEVKKKKKLILITSFECWNYVIFFKKINK